MGSLSFVDPNFDSVQADVRAAEREPMFARIKQMMPNCVLCTRPHRKLAASLHKTEGGVFVPEQHDRLSNEWLLACTVLKVGEGVPPEIVPMVTVIIPQFSGSIIFDDVDGVETSLWIVGDSEIMAVLES